MFIVSFDIQVLSFCIKDIHVMKCFRRSSSNSSNMNTFVSDKVDFGERWEWSGSRFCGRGRIRTTIDKPEKP